MISVAKFAKNTRFCWIDPTPPMHGLNLDEWMVIPEVVGNVRGQDVLPQQVQAGRVLLHINTFGAVQIQVKSKNNWQEISI